MTVCDTTPTYGVHSNVMQVSAGTNIVDLLGVLSHDYSLSMCERWGQKNQVFKVTLLSYRSTLEPSLNYLEARHQTTTTPKYFKGVNGIVVEC